MCDSEILGKKFSEGSKVVDVSASFYGGDEVSVDEFLKLLSQAYMINAVGNECVGLLVNNGFVDSSNVLMIDGVKCAQCLMEKH
ncbi:DUF424 family protein [Candidatus Woesearchaeota archaeon]|nr:DUF424 family protein [Candidatus Woesearchaeota archaeon]